MLIFPLFQFSLSSIIYAHTPPNMAMVLFCLYGGTFDASVVLVISRLHQWPQTFKASTLLDPNQLAEILVGEGRGAPRAPGQDRGPHPSRERS